MSQLRRITRRGERRTSPPRGGAPALDPCCPALHAATAASRRLLPVSLSPSPLSPPPPAPLSAAAPSPTSPSDHAGVSTPRSPRDSGRPEGSHEAPRAQAAHTSSASSAHTPAIAKRMTPESPTTTATRLPPPTSGPLSQRPKRTLTLLGPAPGFASLEEEARSTYTDVTENDYRYGANGYLSTVTSYPCDCKPKLEEGTRTMCRFLFGRGFYEKRNPVRTAMNVVSSWPLTVLARETRADNLRFQRKEWANVKLMKTREKGFGLVAGTDLKKCVRPSLLRVTLSSSGQFVMEYVGEVLPQRQFLQRAEKYAQSGLPHFYFMHLKKDEVRCAKCFARSAVSCVTASHPPGRLRALLVWTKPVPCFSAQVIDATRRGCFARFINHSCNPNCTLQKWVVGNQTRMGFFMKRDVAAGEELTFDYKLERYGYAEEITARFPADSALCGSTACFQAHRTASLACCRAGRKHRYATAVKTTVPDTPNCHEELHPGRHPEMRPAHASYPGPTVGARPPEVAKRNKIMIVVAGFLSGWRFVLLTLYSLQLTTCSKAINHFRYLKGLPLLHSWLKMYKDNTQMIKEVREGIVIAAWNCILQFLPKVNVLDRRTVQDEENEENVGIEFTVEKLVDHEVSEIGALAKIVG
ncbi:MAG: hypothetical protein BJ554DRAFT_725 [Olpidium bornovanus]|uniref:SET domain-containing protein n=1 Tax=Olpidium bornovanus TaxID=278681 RepID=A0A8H7ZTJ3_9FUNG|nr:MAG: hypothetical protein BJ554DRAFT_725 [Olpidium bornovanus]